MMATLRRGEPLTSLHDPTEKKTSRPRSGRVECPLDSASEPIGDIKALVTSMLPERRVAVDDAGCCDSGPTSGLVVVEDSGRLGIRVHMRPTRRGTVCATAVNVARCYYRDSSSHVRSVVKLSLERERPMLSATL